MVGSDQTAADPTDRHAGAADSVDLISVVHLIEMCCVVRLRGSWNWFRIKMVCNGISDVRCLCELPVSQT